MKRTNPSGRTRLIGPSGEILKGEWVEMTPTDLGRETEPRQRSPKPWRAGVPLHHGKHSQAQVDAWDREGQRRAAGGHPIPGWQRTMRAGCCRCMARPGILPADHEKARAMMLEWGWRWGGGMWLCGRCVDEKERE